MALVAVAVAVAVVISGGDDDDDDAAGTGSDSSVDIRTTTEATESTTEASIDGERFQGSTWTMVVPDSWSPIDAVPPAEEHWAAGGRTPQFFSNVNVFVDRSGRGLTMEQYVDASIRNADQFGLEVEVLDSGVDTFDDGTEYGRLVYDIGGEVPTSALGIFVEVDDGYAVVTLVAAPERFEEDRAELEPFMATLRPS